MAVKDAGRVAKAAYRLVLLLYPRRVRQRFGDEQIYLFEQAWREERPHSRFPLGWTIVQLLLGLRAAAAVHLDRLQPPPRYAIRAQSRPFHRGSIRRELRSAVRSLLATPWYSAAVVAVFTLGLALSTVVFAIVDGVLFKPLPYPRADELFLVRPEINHAPAAETTLVTGREALAWMEAVGSDAAITKMSAPSTIGRLGARDFFAASIDERFFDVVGIAPAIGGFTADEFQARSSPELEREPFPRALISHDLWMTVAGGARDVIGRRVILTANGLRGVHVAGVLPRGFVFPSSAEVPLIGVRQPDVLLPMARLQRHELDWPGFLIVARIADGGGVVSVHERLRAVTIAFTNNPPVSDIQHHHLDAKRPPYDTVTLEPVTEHLGARERPAFALVTAATGLLLALVCVNAAALTAARSLYRRRDLAIRRALGASGWDLARGVLAELLILTGAGALLALLASPVLLQRTVSLLPDSVTLLKAPDVDGRVFLAATLVAFGSALVVLVWPALMASRASTFLASGRLESGSTRLGRRSGLILLSMQAAIGFILLTAGGLTLGSIAAAWRSDVGYRRDRVVILEAFLRDASAKPNAYEEVVAFRDALRRVAGVAGVATTDASLRLLARDSRPWSGVKPAGSQAAPPGLASRSVSAEYFAVMGLPFIEGAPPAPGEWNSNRLAVISESASRLLWPDRSPIGQHFVPNRSQRETAPTWRVVGVVRDARYRAIDQQPIADVYLADQIDRGRYGSFFLLRTSADPDAVIPALAALADARGFWTERVMPLDDALFATMRPRFLPAWLFASLGSVGVVVLAAGSFGLLAMSAAQRTREIVIRTALGAPPGRVLGLLARDQIASVTIGIAAGALISVWAMNAVQGHLYGVTPHEPAVWTSVAIVMIIVATLGTLLPAARAVRVNPALALKE